MMYGNIKIELKYFLNFKFVLVIKNANNPPNTIEIKQVKTARSTVFNIGVHRLLFASLLVNKST